MHRTTPTSARTRAHRTDLAHARLGKHKEDADHLPQVTAAAAAVDDKPSTYFPRRPLTFELQTGYAQTALRAWLCSAVAQRPKQQPTVQLVHWGLWVGELHALEHALLVSIGTPWQRRFEQNAERGLRLFWRFRESLER